MIWEGRSGYGCQRMAFGSPRRFAQLSPRSGEIVAWMDPSLNLHQVSYWWRVETVTIMGTRGRGRGRRIHGRTYRTCTCSWVLRRKTTCSVGLVGVAGLRPSFFFGVYSSPFLLLFLLFELTFEISFHSKDFRKKLIKYFLKSLLNLKYFGTYIANKINKIFNFMTRV